MYATVTALMVQVMLVNVPVLMRPASPIQLHPIEAKIVAKTNDARVRHGMKPLKIDALLVLSARGHAAWMTRNRSLQHTTKAVGENIAMGQSSSTEAVRDWMSSPGHRANILNTGYTRIGVAAYVTPDGTIFWCQQFLR